MEAYSFVETMERYNNSHITMDRDSFDRNISEVTKPSNGAIDTSYCPAGQWHKLSQEEKNKICAACDKSGKSPKGKHSKKENKAFCKLKHKLAELALDLESDGGTNEVGNNGSQGGSNGNKWQKPSGGSSAADEFGCQAHVIIKKLSIIGSLDDDSGSASPE